MTQVDLSSYKGLFVKTASEYLEKLTNGLDQTDLNTNTEAINNIYISIHSLGSQNLTMGYSSTGALCRLIENYFYKVKNGEQTIDEQKIQYLKGAVAKVKESLTSVEANNAELNLDDEQKTIKERLSL